MFALLLASALSLDGSWEFAFREGRPCHEAIEPEFVATDRIPVPGCFDAMPKWYMKRGTGLYRRTFTLDRPLESSWLVVDGLGLYGRFFVDGREIGTDDLPWSRVELEVGALSAGTHTVFAAVDNRFDWSYQKLVRTYYDFHCWGGFFRGVSLVSDNRRLFVRTRDYRTGEVEVEVANEVKVGGEGERRKLVFDGKNEVEVVFKDGKATVKVPDFKLWSPEHPNLHEVEVADSRASLTSGQESASPLKARFGIRTIEAKDRGLYLNGERIFLKGANRHDQQLQLGAATPEGYMLIDIQNLKAMGGNFFRGAHYPQSQRFLDLCDENGVMVWEESLGWGNGQEYTRQNDVNELTDPDFIEKQVRQTRLMVRNSFNHPSVIIFAFLNEFASDTPEGKPIADKLIETIKAEDSGRLVTFACNRIVGDLCNENTDIISINTYPGTIYSPPGLHEELRDKLHNQEGSGVDWVTRYFREKYPEKTMIISEMGASGIYGQHDLSAATNSEEFQCEHNGLVAEAVYANPDLAGLAFWQFFDTRTCWRDCGRDGKKNLSFSSAGQFTWWRQPKAVVTVLADWFRNRTPANLKAGQSRR